MCLFPVAACLFPVLAGFDAVRLGLRSVDRRRPSVLDGLVAVPLGPLPGGRQIGSVPCCQVPVAAAEHPIHRRVGSVGSGASAGRAVLGLPSLRSQVTGVGGAVPRLGQAVAPVGSLHQGPDVELVIRLGFVPRIGKRITPVGDAVALLGRDIPRVGDTVAIVSGFITLMQAAFALRQGVLPLVPRQGIHANLHIALLRTRRPLRERHRSR